jgi:hypothetical protein
MRHALPLAVLCCALLAPLARGQVIVNSFLDQPDADLNDGLADFDPDAPGQQITLRAAIQQADHDGGATTIQLPAGTYLLTLKGADEDDAATGDLDIDADITITGDGAATTIIDAHKLKDRIFEVHSGNVEISGLTLLKGAAPKDETGGGLRNHGGTVAFHDAIIAKCRSGLDAGGFDTRGGSSTLTDVLIQKCKAKADGGGMGADGGDATLDRVTFDRNKAHGSGGGWENFGQTIEATNCTLSGNGAKNGGGISLAGGAIQTLTNCTIAKNHGKHGSGIATDDDTEGSNECVVQNTIFANKAKTNCAGELISEGGNIDTGTSCGFSKGDQSSTNPQLSKLADNGGKTPTMAIAADSPAVDVGTDLGAPSIDQRGQTRVDVQGVGTSITDSGAYELEQRG